MTALESWEYGDPERVAIRRELDALRKAKACGQCVYKVTTEWNGEKYFGCEFKRRVYGIRCELFKRMKS
jgi:hypothetical protein